jgi:hypothetical protein
VHVYDGILGHRVHTCLFDLISDEFIAWPLVVIIMEESGHIAVLGHACQTYLILFPLLT